MNHYNGWPGEQRDKAQRWLNAEVRAGRLTKPRACMACGQTVGIIDFHAEDYGEPFGPKTHEYHLCVLCHLVLHCRFQAPVAWTMYRQLVAAGVQFAAVSGRDFGAVRRLIKDLETMPLLAVKRGRGGETEHRLPRHLCRPFRELDPPRVRVLDSIHVGGAPSPDKPRVAPVRLLYQPFPGAPR